MTLRMGKYLNPLHQKNVLLHGFPVYKFKIIIFLWSLALLVVEHSGFYDFFCWTYGRLSKVHHLCIGIVSRLKS